MGRAGGQERGRRVVTLPGVSVLDAAFALTVAAGSIVTGNPVGAAISLAVAACWFGLSAFLAYRNPE